MPVIDDMDGLFSHASDAYRAGHKSGRDDAFTAALSSLSLISHGYEKSGDVQAFRAAEAACKALKEVSDRLNKPKTL